MNVILLLQTSNYIYRLSIDWTEASFNFCHYFFNCRRLHYTQGYLDHAQYLGSAPQSHWVERSRAVHTGKTSQWRRNNGAKTEQVLIFTFMMARAYQGTVTWFLFLWEWNGISHNTAQDATCPRRYIYRADFGPSQWETALRCNDVSHWLGAILESALHLVLMSGR